MSRKGFGSSIERWGVDDTLNGFDLAVNNGAMYYTVWQGGTLKYSHDEGDDIAGDGKEVFKNMIDAAALGGSTAQYTICFYKKPGKNDTIDSNTPYDSSFNFKLQDKTTMVPYTNMAGIGNAGNNAMMEAIAGINRRLDAFEAADLEQPEEDPIEKIGRIVETPAVQSLISGIGSFLNNMVMNATRGNTARPRGMAGVDDMTADELQAQKQKAVEALNRLIKLDAQIGDHLLQLADMAERDPKKYTFALSML